MRISKIKIQNFRSIKAAEVNPSNFNIFIGQNNHGKTNFFEALDWFFNGLRKGDSIEKIRFGRTGIEEVFVEVEFEGAQEGANKMKNAANKTKILDVLKNQDKIVIKRSSSGDIKKRIIFINGMPLEKNPTGFDNALNDFLPCFEYVSTQINPLEMVKYGKNTPIANMLSGVLSAILEQDPNYAAFKEKFEELFTMPDSRVRIELNHLSSEVKVYLEKQFPDCLSVVFEVSAPVFEDLLKNFETSIDDGVYTDASEKGDGMQRALMLAIIQAYADFRRENEETSKYFLFFIDEGELHLHPTAQRKLKNALLELAEGGDQVFINTHSSVLVSDETASQTIFKVEKIDKATNITPSPEEKKPYIVYELLGGSPADLLLPKNFILVEGKSDLEFLSRVTSRHYPEKPLIQIIPADGDVVQAGRSLNAIEQIFKPLDKSIYKDKTVIYLDKQNNAAQLASFLAAHPNLQGNTQFFEAATGSIEEYYPAPWKKIQAEVGVMSSDDKLNLARQVGNGISKGDFEAEMPKAFEALKRSWELAYN